MDLKALYKISYGLYVISSKKGDKFNGQIGNAAIQVTSEPSAIAVCINKQNLTHEFIAASKVFAISILARTTPLQFIGHFGFKSGREVDKFQNVQHRISVTGAPVVLENAIGYVEVELTKTLDVGTHTIFVGKIVNAEVLKDEEPMTYAYYHEVKRGRSPQAPTFVKEDRKEEPAMDKYVCTVCNYVYDPAKGDPESGVKPGTPFEKLPADWVCPICGADKSVFEKEK